jgi:hypothetical protein
VGIQAVAAPLSSRQAHVAAVPAALLTAWTLTTACERVATKADAAALATRLAPAAIVVVLVVAALADHHAAADVHGRAALLSRTLEDEVRAAAARAPVNVTLVNMPGHVGGRGVQAAVFENGLDDMVRITAPAVGKVDIWRLPLPGAPDDYNSLSVPSDSERLRARLLEPSSAVILYQTRSGPVVLTPAGLDDSADEDAPREQASRMRE